MSRVARGLRGLGLNRRGFGTPWGDSTPPLNSASGSFGSGVVGGWEAITIVLACVKAVYEDFLVPDFIAYQGDRQGSRRPIGSQPLIVTQPFGPDQDTAAGMAQLVVSRMLRGNWYCAVADIDELGLPTLLTILNPDRCKAVPDPDTGVKCIRVNDRGQFKLLKPGQYVHGTGLTWAGQMSGIDILSAQREAFGAVAAVESFGADWFSSGGTPSGVVSFPGNMNRDKVKQQSDAWDARHSGPGNSHRPVFLTNGAKFDALSITPENAQFLDTRRYNREELCGLFGVPLQRVQAIIENASQGGGAGIEGIDAQYFAHTLLSTGRSVERVWDRLIDGNLSTWTGFDWRAFLRVSAAQRATIASQHRVGAIRTIDEIRAEEGWAPLPGGVGADPFTSLNSNKGSAAQGSEAKDVLPGNLDPDGVPIEGTGDGSPT